MAKKCTLAIEVINTRSQGTAAGTSPTGVGSRVSRVA